MYLEHWLYLPIIGVIFSLCFVFDKFSEKRKQAITIFLLLILILFSVRIIARNVEWGDPIKFYQNELKYTQTSARIYNNLAMELSDQGDCVSAVPNYEKAISLSDAYPQTHHNLARCLEALGRPQEAANEYLRALYIEPNFAYSINALYVMFSRVGDKRSGNFLELIEKLASGVILTTADIQDAVK